MGGAAATFGWAWIAATIALLLHVADEASHDFLALYNPQARRIRHLLGDIPFPPTFTFPQWLIGLGAGIALLAALTPYAFTANPWMPLFAYFVAAIHVANGFGHIVGSLVTRRRLPGVLSAPLLLLTGGWLAYSAVNLK